MQTHKNIFFWTLIVTLVTTAGYFLTKENSLIGDFCLALLGSSAICKQSSKMHTFSPQNTQFL